MARLLAHMQAVRDHWHSIVWLKDALDRDDEWAFKEVWESLGKDREETHAIHKQLWISTKGGGIWTPAERRKMDEWRC